MTTVKMGGGLTSCSLFLSFFASGILHLIITHGLITGEYELMDAWMSSFYDNEKCINSF